MAEQREFGTKPIVKLAGNRLPGEVEANVKAVIVESDLTAPGACLITFADPDRSVLKTIGVDFLQPVEISASAVEESGQEPIFTGEVYGFDFAEDDTGTYALVRAYDAVYKLKQRRGITSFNDVTDGDVVRQLAQDAGVEPGNIDGGDVIHKYLAQTNQTHWDFLLERAAANDRVLQVRDGRLDFTRSPEASGAPAPGDHGSTDPLQLIAGHNLVYLRVRTTAAQQVSEVEIRGWDPANKEAVVASAGSASRGAQIDATPADVGGQHGAQTRVAAFPGLTTQAECDAIAASIAQREGASFTHAEGQALGDPRLRAGVPVSLGKTGPFDGRYTLTSARHVFDDSGYHTFVSVSGDHDRSLHGLTNGSAGANGQGQGSGGFQRFDGVYPAIVTNIEDPEKLGRVKLELPWLAGDYETDWSRVMQVGGGDDRGVLWFPEVGDEVVVSFLAGNPSRPLVIGGLYNGKDKPPFDGFDDLGDGKVDTRGLKTRIGHALVFNDKSGDESIRVETADGSVKITLDQSKKELHIESKGDIEVKADGNVTVAAARDLTLEASGSATVKANASLKLESKGQVSVSGAAIKLN